MDLQGGMNFTFALHLPPYSVSYFTSLSNPHILSWVNPASPMVVSYLVVAIISGPNKSSLKGQSSPGKSPVLPSTDRNQCLKAGDSVVVA